jgi:hypothetical protein
MVKGSHLTYVVSADDPPRRPVRQGPFAVERLPDCEQWRECEVARLEIVGSEELVTFPQLDIQQGIETCSQHTAKQTGFTTRRQNGPMWRWDEGVLARLRVVC